MIPVSDVDLYADEALADPYPHLRALRDLGPVVRLSAQDVYVVTRYADVRAVLDDPVTFCSGEGVGLNDFINAGGQGTTLMSDGDQHARLREVIGRPLTTKAVAELRPDAQALADDLVDRLVGRRTVDAVQDLAEVLPATWVPDLLGWPDGGRDRLLDWASDTFDCLGPLNDRAAAAGPGLLEMSAFAQQVASSTLPEGSMASRDPRCRGAGRHRGAPVPDGDHRLPRSVVGHHRRRHRQRRLAVRHPPGPVGADAT